MNSRHRVWFVLGTIVLAGCTPVGAPHPAANAGAFESLAEQLAEQLAELPRPIPTSVDALFPMGQVALPPHFQELELDATYEGTQEAEIEVEGVDASASVSMDLFDPIAQLKVTLHVDPEQLEQRIYDRWGPPFGLSEPSSRPVWIDPDTRLRVELNGDRITYSRYVPLQSLLGDTPGEFTFEHEPLLGSKRSDFISSYHPKVLHLDPDYGEERDLFFLELPQTELSDGTTSASVRFDEEDRVTSVTMFVDFERRQDAKKVLVNPLLQRWGEGEDYSILFGADKIWRSDIDVTLSGTWGGYHITKRLPWRRPSSGSAARVAPRRGARRSRTRRG